MAAGPAFAASGELDTSFGSGGGVVLDFKQHEEALTARILGDGKILVFAISYDPVADRSYASLARLLADGAPDASFGDSGKLSVELDTRYTPSWIAAATIQPDGKVFLTGVVGRRMAVARLLADGSSDSTFGGGMALADFGSGFAAAPRAMALQDDGKVVVAGVVRGNYSPYSQFALARFNVDGTLDSSFSDNGLQVSLSSQQPTEEARAVAVQADGKIVAGGEMSSGMVLARYHVNGAPDTGFGCNGFLYNAVGERARILALALPPNGAIVAAGETCTGSTCTAVVARFLGGGADDTAFGQAGKAVLAAVDAPTGMAVQPDGAVLLVANHFVDGQLPTARVVRLQPDGNPDVAFNAAAPELADTRLAAIQADASDGVLVTGSRLAASASDAYVARLLRGNDGPAPTAVEQTAPDCGGPSVGGGPIVSPSENDYSASGAIGLPMLLGLLGLAVLRKRQAIR